MKLTTVTITLTVRHEDDVNVDSLAEEMLDDSTIQDELFDRMSDAYGSDDDDVPPGLVTDASVRTCTMDDAGEGTP